MKKYGKYIFIGGAAIMFSIAAFLGSEELWELGLNLLDNAEVAGEVADAPAE